MHEAEEKKFEYVCSKLCHSLSLLKSSSIKNLKVNQHEAFLLVKEFFTMLDHKVRDMTKRQSCLQLATHLNEFKRLFCTICRVGMYVMANPESKMFSWTYVIRELEFCIKKIIFISKTTYVHEENKEIGQFVNKIDQLLHLLSLRQNIEIINLSTDELIKDVLNFSMDVSHMANRSTQQEIMQCCQQVLHHHDVCADLLEDLQADSGNDALRDLFTSKCETLVQSIEHLESIVNIAVLQLMAEKFPQISGHFLKALNSFKMKEQNDDSKHSSSNVILNFFEEADHLYQICKFAVACSTDYKIAYQVLTAVESLENLDPEITPTVAAFKQNPESKSVHFHLRLIKQLWRSQIDSLINDIIAITDVTALLSVLRLLAAKKMDEAIQSMETEKIEYIIGCANFIITTVSASKCYDVKDMILQEKINKLKIAIASTKSLCCTTNFPAAALQSPRKVQKHIKILVHCIGKLCDHTKQLFNPLSKQEESEQQEITAEKNENTPIHSYLNQEQISIDLSPDSNDIGSISKGTSVFKTHPRCEANSTLQIDITAVLEQLQTQISCFTFENISSEVSQDPSEVSSVKSACTDNSFSISKDRINKSIIENRRNKSSTDSDKRYHNSESLVIEKLRSEESKVNGSTNEEISVKDLELESTRSSNELHSSACKQESHKCLDITTEENEIISCCNSVIKVWNNLNVEIEQVESCKEKMYIKPTVTMAKDISELSLKLIASVKTTKVDQDLHYSLAKEIATKGELLVKFIRGFSSSVSDKRIYIEFHNLCQRLALICHQLHVVSSVGANVGNKGINAAVLKSVENVLKEVMGILSLQMMALGKVSARSMVDGIETVVRTPRSKVFQNTQ